MRAHVTTQRGPVVLGFAGVAVLGVSMLGLGGAPSGQASALPAATPAPAASPIAATPDLEITDAEVRHLADLGVLLFQIEVAGVAGRTTPALRGALDGAPVLGYVVPTTLQPAAVGFGAPDGLVALAVTSHPDFDDTPLFDESTDGDYANDGAVWHAHWVLVGPDDRVPGGLAVQEVAESEVDALLPPTSPGLPLYLDSPGFGVQLRDGILRVVVPVPRVGGETGFGFDAASTYLQLNTSNPDRPMLGVYDVYGILSGDLSLPFEVEEDGRPE